MNECWMNQSRVLSLNEEVQHTPNTSLYERENIELGREPVSEIIDLEWSRMSINRWTSRFLISNKISSKF